MFFAMCFSIKSWCYSVLIYHNANPPYSYTENGKLKGIFPDLFKEISKLTGVKFEFESYSVMRGQLLFDNGKIDIEPGINPIWRVDRAVSGIYSISYAYSQEVIVSNKPDKIQNPQSLYGKLIGIVRGYKYNDFEQHFGPFKIEKLEGRSEPDLLKLLAKGRIDYALMGETTAQYYINERYGNLSLVYTVERTPVSIRFQPHLKELKQKVNDALKLLIDNGTIEQIYIKNTGNNSDLLDSL